MRYVEYREQIVAFLKCYPAFDEMSDSEVWNLWLDATNSDEPERIAKAIKVIEYITIGNSEMVN